MKMNSLASRLAVIGTMTFVNSCVEGTAIECAGNWLCPAHMRCAPDGGEYCIDKNCGSGFVDSQSEQCDGDGNGVPGETAECNINCTKSVKGDGWVNKAAGEECDGDGQGNGGETAECNSNCTFAKHGDGVVNRLFGEECDGNNGINCQSSICTADCKWKRTANCGNGIVDSGEECDGDGQGNPGETKECNIICTLVKAGDGIVNRTAGEQCDGNNDGLPTPEGKGCESETCNDNCTIRTKNDGRINDTAGEICDNGTDNGKVICDKYGEGEQCTYCTVDYQEAKINAPYCGDRELTKEHEECDNQISVNCGTCGDRGTPLACQNISPVPASGEIIVTDGKAMIDAAKNNKPNSFTLSDKLMGSVAFDIRWDCSSSTCIGLNGVENNPVAIAGHIAGTINKGRGNLRIKATQNGSTIKLEGISSGKSGNQPIETTGKHGFEVEPMTGGVGCDINAACNQDSDCASKKCVNNACSL